MIVYAHDWTARLNCCANYEAKHRDREREREWVSQSERRQEKFVDLFGNLGTIATQISGNKSLDLI